MPSGLILTFGFIFYCISLVTWYFNTRPLATFMVVGLTSLLLNVLSAFFFLSKSLILNEGLA